MANQGALDWQLSRTEFYNRFAKTTHEGELLVAQGFSEPGKLVIEVPLLPANYYLTKCISHGQLG